MSDNQDAKAKLKEFEMIVSSAYLNQKEGKSMTPEELAEFKARRDNILTKYSISYERKHFGKSLISIRDKK
jgi:hypothetical protein